MVEGDGSDKTASSDLALPPRPMEEEGERRGAVLPWSVVPVALVLGTVAGGLELAQAAGRASGSGWVEPGLRTLAVGAMTCALATALVMSDRVLGRWRREVRWPVGVVALGVLAAGVLVFASLHAPLQWAVLHMDAAEAALLAAVGTARGALLAMVLALVCRSRKGLAWKAVVVGLALEIVLLEAYLPLIALIEPYQYVGAPLPAGPVGWLAQRLWRPVRIGWGNVGLLKWCPAGLALAAAVGGTLHWARARAQTEGERAPASRGRRWRQVAVVVVLVAIGLVGVTRFGRVMLRRAVAQQDARAVERWLALGVNPDRFALDRGALPLHWAARQQDTEIVRLLLEHGADPNARTEGGERTALHFGVGSIEVARLLLQHGAQVDAREVVLWRPLSSGRTPLHMAMGYGVDDVALLLLDQGADPRAVDGSDRTPLHGAASRGMIRTVRALLDAGVDINAQDDEGNTPLHSAARGSQGPTAELLLAHGANTQLQNADGRTAAELARGGGHP